MARKSASLGELLRAGIPVPPGFALSTGAFSAFLAENDLEDEVAARLAEAAPGDLQAVSAASEAIAAAMRAAPLPSAVRNEVERTLPRAGRG